MTSAKQGMCLTPQQSVETIASHWRNIPEIIQQNLGKDPEVVKNVERRRH